VTVPVPSICIATLSVRFCVKTAVVAASPVSVSEQVFVVSPLHAPTQPVKTEPPAPGVAVSVTVVPSAKVLLHVETMQLIPPGIEATEPVPLPPMVTVSVRMTVGGSNVAVADVSVLSVNVHAPVPAPLHAPAQPANVEPPPAGVAVSVTSVPSAKEALHVPEEQEIPEGEEVTVPLPLPAIVTESEWCTTGTASKVAVTDMSTPMVTVQPPVPLHATPQPASTDPPLGAAVRFTTVPWANEALHVPLVQEIPGGEDVTVPAPVPAIVTVSVWFTPPPSSPPPPLHPTSIEATTAPTSHVLAMIPPPGEVPLPLRPA
jgi:hypothetical protein